MITYPDIKIRYKQSVTARSLAAICIAQLFRALQPLRAWSE
jgi:hypothetical protein